MLVGASVLAISLLGISTFFQGTLQASSITQTLVQGDYLLEEGMEVMKVLRDTSYTNNIAKLSTTTPYYLSWNGTSWATSTVSAAIDSKFYRTIVLTDVKRDSTTQDIASVGVFDPNTKQITVSVAWNRKAATTTRSISTYIMNLFNN